MRGLLLLPPLPLGPALGAPVTLVVVTAAALLPPLRCRPRSRWQCYRCRAPALHRCTSSSFPVVLRDGTLTEPHRGTQRHPAAC